LRGQFLPKTRTNARPRRESSSTANAPSIGRLDVELFTDVGLFADQLTSSARRLLASRLRRLPEVDRSPALGHLVRDPRLEAQARNLLELIDRLVSQVAAQLLDRGLRVGEVPEDEAEQHARLLEEPLVIRQLLEQLLDLAQDVRLLVTEVVEIGVQRIRTSFSSSFVSSIV
jgi:hypothetical protein